MNTTQTFFEEQMENCIKDFVKLYQRYQYISHHEIDLFCEKYSDVFSLLPNYKEFENTINYKKMVMLSGKIYQMIEEHNRIFIKKSLEKEKEYFDNCFQKVDPTIQLDEEQRIAILNDEDYSLIIAGAGAGKTTTMAAKVKYLVEKKNIPPQSILVISFTNKAVNELITRINDTFQIPCEIKTFHKLGCDILKETKYSSLSPIFEGETYKLLFDYLKTTIFENKDQLKKVLHLFNNYLDIPTEALTFDTLEDYHAYRTNKLFISLKDRIGEYNKTIIDKRKKYYRTINSENLRSTEEVRIANFLYMNGIDYQYEKIYPIKIEGKILRPDFYITQGENKAYIEHFGISETLENNRYSKKELEHYIECMNRKRKRYHDDGTTLIETYSKYKDGRDLLDHLQEQLIQNGFLLNPISEEEVYKKLMETSSDDYFSKFIHFAMDFIGKCKSLGINNPLTLLEKTNDKRLTEYIEVLNEMYLYYDKELKKRKKIDFADMINEAIIEVDNFKNHFPYRYIIIDEYQDISHQRYLLTQKLAKLYHSKIIAVGDDWQSIFAFSGASMELFTKFKELSGYAEELKISHTYRNSQELIDLAGSFITKNNEQIKKQLISNKHIDKPVYVYSYDDTNYKETKKIKAKVISTMIEELYHQNPNHSILLIGRYNHDIYPFFDTDYFEKGEEDKIICKNVPTANVTYLTAHRSKGLGFDQVIIINAIDDTFGFPSKVKDDPIFSLFQEKESSNVEFAEERRLFYVAMTRTKNRLYIFVPKSKPSKFVLEIKNHASVLFKDDLLEQYNKKKEIWKCPKCSYPLEKVWDNEINSIVYRCTNELELCDFITNNIERKLPISRCECGGFLIDKGFSKASQNQVILGCTNYPTCKNIKICDLNPYNKHYQNLITFIRKKIS